MLSSFRESFFRLLVPQSDQRSPDYRQRVMALVDALWIGSITVFLILPLYYWWVGFAQGLWVLLHSVFYLLLLSLTLRFSGNLVLVAHLIGISVLNTFSPMAYWSGGVNSPVLVLYLMMIPVIFDIAGRRVGMLWAGIYFTALVAWLVLSILEVNLPNAFATGDKPYFSFVTTAGIFIFLVLFNRQWDVAREEVNDDLEQKRQLLIQQEKMASLGQLTAGIAHEINNPVNYVSNSTFALAADLEDLRPLLQRLQALSKKEASEEELREVLQEAETLELDFLLTEIDGLIASIQNGSERIQQIVQGLKTFSYSSRDQADTFDLNLILDNVLLILSSKIKHQEITIEKEYCPAASVYCHTGQMNQVFTNLLDNAIQAVPAGGKIRLVTSLTATDCTVMIEDNGAGMDEATQRQIFDPFFTTKGIGQGTGLGLSISYGIIVKEHQGQIWVESEPRKGTRFFIRLPIQQTPQLDI